MIDSHRHYYPGRSDENGLFEELKRDGFSRTVLCGYQYHADEGSLPHALDRAVLEVWKRHPEEVIPFFCDFRLDDSRLWDYIRESAESFAGMGEILLGHGPTRQRNPELRLDDPRFLDTCRIAGEKGLPVIFHADLPFAEEAERLVRACPGTRFIWAHCGYDYTAPYGGKGRSAEWAAERLEEYSNLYFDLSHWIISPLYLTRGDWPAVLERYDNRFLLGLDSSVDYLTQGHWSEILLAILSRLPEASVRKIEEENLLGLLPGKWR